MKKLLDMNECILDISLNKYVYSSTTYSILYSCTTCNVHYSPACMYNSSKWCLPFGIIKDGVCNWQPLQFFLKRGCELPFSMVHGHCTYFSGDYPTLYVIGLLFCLVHQKVSTCARVLTWVCAQCNISCTSTLERVPTFLRNCNSQLFLENVLILITENGVFTIVSWNSVLPTFCPISCIGS